MSMRKAARASRPFILIAALQTYKECGFSLGACQYKPTRRISHHLYYSF